MGKRSAKKKRFKKILEDIKTLKIQGAENIAKKALYAYSLFPTKRSKRKLLSLRPTEPLLQNVLSLVDKVPTKKILSHFKDSQQKINQLTLKLIKNGDVIFTHCHSSTVVHALIYAKQKGKKFEVYNTETRPLFQGRKTAIELKKAGIKVTHFADAAVGVALSKEQSTKKVTKVFLGADAILRSGVINKIGSEVIAILAKKQGVPVYVLADSWKFSSKLLKMEQRGYKEIWKRIPKIFGIKVKNPAFEFVPKKYITALVTELGILDYSSFLRKKLKESQKV